MAGIFQNEDIVNAVIRVRRGKDVDRQSTQYEDGELVYTVDKKRLYMGDGLGLDGTVGGNIVGNKVWYTNNFQNLTGNIEKYDLVYRWDSKGFYMLVGDQPTNATSYVLLGGDELLPDDVLTKPLSEDYIPKASTVTIGGVKIGNGLIVRNDGSLDVNFDTNELQLNTVTNQLKVNVTKLKPDIASPAGYSKLGTVNIVPYKGLAVNDVNGELYIDLDLDTLKLSSVSPTRTVIYGDPHKASFTEHGVVKFQSDYLTYTSPISVTNGVASFGYDNVTLKVNGNRKLYVDLDEFKSQVADPNPFKLYLDNVIAGTQKLNIQQDYLNVTNTGDLEILPANDLNLGLIKVGTVGLSSSNDGTLNVNLDNITLTSNNSKITLNETASVSSKYTGYIKRWDNLTMLYGTMTGVSTNGSLNTVIFPIFLTDGCGPVTITTQHPTLTGISVTIRNINSNGFTFVANATTTSAITAHWHAYAIA